MSDVGSKSSEMNKSLRIFIVVQGLNFLTLNLGNVFISLFLIHTSTNSMSALLYNLFISITILISFFILSPISKRYDKKFGIILGNALSLILYLAIIILGDNSSNYVWGLGAISGLGQGFFWNSVNTLSVDLTNYDNRKSYNSITGMIMSASNMLGPIMASVIIASFTGLQGYIILFALIIGIMVISITFTVFIGPTKGEGVFSINKCKEKLDMNKFKIISKITWKSMFRDGVVGFLLSIMLFQVTKSELVMSKIVAFMTIVSIIVYLVVSKIKAKIKSVYIVGNILQVISILILTTYLNNIYVILFYSIIYGIAAPLTGIGYSIIGQNKIQAIDEQGNFRFELNCIREVWVGVGRISAIILLVLLYSINNDFSNLWIYGVLASGLTIWVINDIKNDCN